MGAGVSYHAHRNTLFASGPSDEKSIGLSSSMKRARGGSRIQHKAEERGHDSAQYIAKNGKIEGRKPTEPRETGTTCTPCISWHLAAQHGARGSWQRPMRCEAENKREGRTGQKAGTVYTLYVPTGTGSGYFRGRPRPRFTGLSAERLSDACRCIVRARQINNMRSGVSGGQ